MPPNKKPAKRNVPPVVQAAPSRRQVVRSKPKPNVAKPRQPPRSAPHAQPPRRANARVSEQKHAIGPATPHVSHARRMVHSVGRSQNTVDISAEESGVRSALSTLHPELIRGAKVPDAVTSSTATLALTQNYTFNTVNYGSGRFEWGMQICPCMNDQLVIPNTWAGGVVTATGYADNYAYASLVAAVAEFRVVSMSFELTNNTNGLNVQGRWSIGNTRSGLAPLNGVNFDAYSSVPNYVKGTFTVDDPKCRMVWLASDETDRFFKSLTGTVPTAEQTALVLFVESGGLTNTFNLLITTNLEVIPVQSAQTFIPTTANPCNVSTFTDAMSAGIDQAVRGQDKVTNPDKADSSVGGTLATMAKAAVGVAGDVLTDIPGLGKIAEKALGPVADTIGSAVNFFADGIGSLFGMTPVTDGLLRQAMALSSISDTDFADAMKQLAVIERSLELKGELTRSFETLRKLELNIWAESVRRRPSYRGLSRRAGTELRNFPVAAVPFIPSRTPHLSGPVEEGDTESRL